jgi:hypothetical protein
MPWHNFVLHTPADVAVYEAEWDRLWAVSVSGEDLSAWLR